MELTKPVKSIKPIKSIKIQVKLIKLNIVKKNIKKIVPMIFKHYFRIIYILRERRQNFLFF